LHFEFISTNPLFCKVYCDFIFIATSLNPLSCCIANWMRRAPFTQSVCVARSPAKLIKIKALCVSWDREMKGDLIGNPSCAVAARNSDSVTDWRHDSVRLIFFGASGRWRQLWHTTLARSPGEKSSWGRRRSSLVPGQSTANFSSHSAITRAKHCRFCKLAQPFPQVAKIQGILIFLRIYEHFPWRIYKGNISLNFLN
jgi:hypothetical protein